MELYKRIQQLADTNALPHTVIFEGAGRSEVSLFFAKCVVCSDKVRPCNKCSNCKKAEKNVHPDIIELFPKGAMNGYSINEIRRIKEDAFVAPNEAKAKVYIFNDIDNISEVSQNALLKILEEPPKRVVFVLNCQSKAHLLDTIISRAACFLCDTNNNENKDLSGAFDILRTAVFGKELDLLICLNPLLNDKEKRLNTILSIQLALREIYISKVFKREDGQVDIIEALTLNKILQAIDITEDTRIALSMNKSAKLVLVRFCANLKAVFGR